MEFYAVLDQVLDLLRRRGRVSYRALKAQFSLDDDYLEALKDELIDAQRLACDEDGKVLVWTGDAVPTLPVLEPEPALLAYTPLTPAQRSLRARLASDPNIELVDRMESAEAVVSPPQSLKPRHVEPLIEALTAREHDVLALVADGLGNREIAAALGISEHTVKFHLASIFGKLGVSTRTEAVQRGLRLGVIEI